MATHSKDTYNGSQWQDYEEPHEGVGGQWLNGRSTGDVDSAHFIDSLDASDVSHAQNRPLQ